MSADDAALLKGLLETIYAPASAQLAEQTTNAQRILFEGQSSPAAWEWPGLLLAESNVCSSDSFIMLVAYHQAGNRASIVSSELRH